MEQDLSEFIGLMTILPIHGVRELNVESWVCLNKRFNPTRDLC